MRKYSIKPCAWCGAEFQAVRPMHVYCSASCRLAGLHGHLTKSAPPNGQVEITCERCGKTFRDWLSQGRKHCSNECRSLASRNRTTYTCERCGKTFDRPASVRNVHWCSRVCYYAARRDPAFREAIFWSHVDRQENGCWLWTGAKVNGYGYSSVHGTVAHRVVWELSRGEPVPPGLIVMHLCDNRACCRPDHLTVGTQQSNIDDMMKKGRNGNQFSPQKKASGGRLIQTSLLL